MSVMIDIETLGTAPGCAVLSVGAVAFDRDGLGPGFYQTISLKSCEEAGLSIDADTLEWWLEQGEEAREVLTGGGDLRDTLVDLSDFVEGHDEVWANSPSFDCAILEGAFDAVGLETPWAYYMTRDFRTLKNLPVAVDVEHDGLEHDALDDARHQARVASETLAAMYRDSETGSTQGTDHE